MRFFKLPSKYIIAGLLTNALSFAIYSVFIYIDTFSSPVTAYQTSAILVLPVSFYLNRVWVFESVNHRMNEFFKFSAIYAISIFAGSMVLTVVRKSLTNPYFAQFISMAIIGASTFLIHWLWTFKKTHQHVG